MSGSSRTYEWQPGCVVLECDCGQELTLPGTSTAPTCRCGADHSAIVQNLQDREGRLRHVVTHPWQYATRIPPWRLVSLSATDSKSGGPHKPYQLCLHLRYHKLVALSYHNGTTTPCLSLSLPVPLREQNADKSAVLSPCVPPCRPLSLSGSDYESEGRRFESVLPSAPQKFLQNAEKLESPDDSLGGFGSSRAAVDYESAYSSAVAATSLIPGIM